MFLRFQLTKWKEESQKMKKRASELETATDDIKTLHQQQRQALEVEIGMIDCFVCSFFVFAETTGGEDEAGCGRDCRGLTIEHIISIFTLSYIQQMQSKRAQEQAQAAQSMLETMRAERDDLLRRIQVRSFIH